MMPKSIFLLSDQVLHWNIVPGADRKNAEAIYGKSYTMKMGIAEGESLSEYYRNLDRVITMAIPWILESVGYKMIKINADH